MTGPGSGLFVYDAGGAPARNCFAVTPANADLATYTRALYVGTAGNVAVILVDDSAAVTFSNVPAGAILPLACKQVRLTNTTASNIVGLA